MDISWERADLLDFNLSCFTCTLRRLDFFCVPFPYGDWQRKWNWIVSVPDHCLFICFCQRIKRSYVKQKGVNYLWKCGSTGHTNALTHAPCTHLKRSPFCVWSRYGLYSWEVTNRYIFLKPLYFAIINVRVEERRLDICQQKRSAEKITTSGWGQG